MFTTYNKLHGVRSRMESLRKIDPLVFDEEVADNLIKFERVWKVYQAAALSEKTKKIQSCILLNLAGADAILKAESFQYTTHESREDPEVLLIKFREQCMPTKNIIIDRHRFNKTNQKPTEPISSYVASLRILANKCEFGTLTDELIRDRIVCGIHSDRVRKHLLYESKLTLESAVTICKSNEKLGVIEPIQEPTAWVSHMVPARKKDGSIRLCIDPVHLNNALLRPHHPVKTIEDILSNMPNAKVFSILDAKTSFLAGTSRRRIVPFNNLHNIHWSLSVSTHAIWYSRQELKYFNAPLNIYSLTNHVKLW